MRFLLGWLIVLVVVAPGAGFPRSLNPSPSIRPIADLSARRHPDSVATVITDPVALCETAVLEAEQADHLPARLLQAVSLTESGRADPRTGRIRAWPWTINAEGVGHFFDTRKQAIAAVEALRARGVQSIDVGCLQVNLRHHPDAFASLDAAFDPRSNARYAAQFLNRLYAGDKSWKRAIAGYHSETPALGDAYQLLVMARWQPDEIRPQAPGAYGDFAGSGSAYAAFAPRSRVYHSFGP